MVSGKVVAELVFPLAAQPSDGTRTRTSRPNIGNGGGHGLAAGVMEHQLLLIAAVFTLHGGLNLGGEPKLAGSVPGEVALIPPLGGFAEPADLLAALV